MKSPCTGCRLITYWSPSGSEAIREQLSRRSLGDIPDQSIEAETKLNGDSYGSNEIKPTVRIFFTKTMTIQRSSELKIMACSIVDTKPIRRRRRQHTCQAGIRWRSIDMFVVFLLLLLISSSEQRHKVLEDGYNGASSIVLALVPRTKSRKRHSVGRIKSTSLSTPPSLTSDATTSPLFSNRTYKPSPTKFSNPIKPYSRSQSFNSQRNLRPQTNFKALNSLPLSRCTSSSHSPTALHMVLTTPESIIEQASTVNLLDDLIDESVRTSPRRPIMMQFDPSSGWIWRRWKGTVFAETWTSCGKCSVSKTVKSRSHFFFNHFTLEKEHCGGSVALCF